jgi:hypothetical protein
MLMCSNGTFFKSKGIKVRIKSFQLYWHFQKKSHIKVFIFKYRIFAYDNIKKKINI